MQLNERQRALVEENMGLVRRVIADRVHDVGTIGVYSYDDLFQIGCIGLCKAAFTDKFQNTRNQQKTYSEREMRFSTYAYRLIWNEICNALEYATVRRTRMPLADPDELTGAAIDYIPDSELQTDIRSAIASAAAGATGVTAKGIKALQLMAEGYTCREIGGMMCASDKNVAAWVSKARNYLRSNPELINLSYLA